jgi:hypothetical protein
MYNKFTNISFIIIKNRRSNTKEQRTAFGHHIIVRVVALVQHRDQSNSLLNCTADDFHENTSCAYCFILCLKSGKSRLDEL